MLPCMHFLVKSGLLRTKQTQRAHLRKIAYFGTLSTTICDTKHKKAKILIFCLKLFHLNTKNCIESDHGQLEKTYAFSFLRQSFMPARYRFSNQSAQ